jgi:hypothetical protein
MEGVGIITLNFNGLNSTIYGNRMMGCFIKEKLFLAYNKYTTLAKTNSS